MSARQDFLDALAVVEALRPSAGQSPPPVIMKAWTRALELRDEHARKWLDQVGEPRD